MARENESYVTMLRKSAVFATRKRVFLFSLLINGLMLLLFAPVYYHIFTTPAEAQNPILSILLSLLSLVLGSVAVTGIVLSVPKNNPDPFRELREHKYKILDVLVVILVVAFVVGVSGLVGLGIDMILGTGMAVYSILVFVSTILLLFSYYELLLGKKGIIESVTGSVNLVKNNLGRVLVGWIILVVVAGLLFLVYALPGAVLFGLAVVKGLASNPQLMDVMASNETTMMANMTVADMIDTSVFTSNIVATVFAVLVFWAGSAFVQAFQLAYMAHLYRSVSSQSPREKKKK